MNLPPDRYPADETMMRTLRDALAMVVIALAETMPATHRARFAANLSGLARAAEKQGNTQLETAVMDLWRAAKGP